QHGVDLPGDQLLAAALQAGRRRGAAAEQHPRVRSTDQADREPVLGRDPGDEAARGLLLLRQPARCPPGRRCGVPQRPPPGHPALPDTKRENADEKIRIKTLSLGVVIPDITFELAKKNEPMYLFSPYDVEREYGKPFADVNVSEVYREMVDNPNISKKKIQARDFFQILAELQFEP